MSVCAYKRFKKTKLCTSDLSHRIEIQSRVVGGVPFGVTEPVAVFTTLHTVWAAIESVGGIRSAGGVQYFNKVNTADSPTDFFYVRYEAAISGLEVSNNFILFNNKRFRILSIENIGRDNSTLVIQCTDRGEEGKEAASG